MQGRKDSRIRMTRTSFEKKTLKGIRDSYSNTKLFCIPGNSFQVNNIIYTLIMSFERYGWFIGRKFKFIFKLLKQVEEKFYFFGRFMMSLRRQRFLKFPSYPSLCESSSSSSLVILCFFIFLGKNRDGVAARNAFVSPVLVNTNKALTIYCSI